MPKKKAQRKPRYLTQYINHWKRIMHIIAWANLSLPALPQENPRHMLLFQGFILILINQANKLVNILQRQGTTWYSGTFSQDFLQQ